MRERALEFGETGTLTGVVSEPLSGADPADPSGVAERLPGVILLNAGILHRVGPSRMNVRIARALAERGFTCLRFDFSGIGDSEPRTDRLPFEESSVLEIREAMDHLQETRGCDRFVLVGLCSGADAAYQGALADERVVGMIPIDGHAYRDWQYYVHRYLPRLFRLRSWWNLIRGRSYVGAWVRERISRVTRRLSSASEGAGGGSGVDGGGAVDGGRARDEGFDDAAGQVFQRPVPPKAEVEDALRTLVGRRVEMLHLFSGGMDDVYNHASQFRNTFRDVDFEGRVEVHFFPAATHTFTDLDQLGSLVARVEAWCVRKWRVSDTSALERRGERAA